MDGMREHIKDYGYFITKTNSQLEFVELCNSLGNFSSNRIGERKIKVLRPLDRNEAHPKSLSSIHGLNPFPFHTDGAHKLVPPRFLAFRYIGKCKFPEPTLLLDFRSQKLTSEEEFFITNRIWKIDDGFKVYYRPIKDALRNLIRYDSGCMSLVDELIEDKNIIERLIEKFHITSISWELNKTMIIDNWRLMHGRPQISRTNKESRILERINIK